jgi:hypothetical protein
MINNLRALMTPDDAQALREPFPRDLIEYKEMHGRQFAYINHALVTDRLIRVDPCWYWEPMATTERGAPLLDPFNGLWIRLTVLGVTRIGFGAAEPHQKGADAVKTAISDAIKNAAMRFGVALDCWAGENGEPALAVVRSIPVPPTEDEPWNIENETQETPTLDVENLCEHGERRFKKANDGKWAAYFCPENVFGCQPIDAKTGRAWPPRR